MKISFHGADLEVTGSCHMVECNGKKILIDCGLYQGSREMVEDNAQDFGFDVPSIDFLLLTHAHLDHCGRIPLLSKRGFSGEIITTSASRELARLIMLDSANLQEEEAAYQNRKAARSRGRNHNAEPIQPLYTVLDALNSMDNFGRTAVYQQVIDVAPGIKATFYDAGHILGSASILLELEEKNNKRRLLFSGDLGYSGRVILRNPTVPPDIDIVVMETTYGDRQHKQLNPSIAELYDGILDTFQRGGNVIIPTFALERTQEILYFLRDGVEQNILPESIQVFLDSPMAISATEIFKRHPECYDQEAAELFVKGKDPFSLPGLHFTRETAQSMALNNINGGAVIIAGSGMCTGGRIRHHLRTNLGRESSSIIFVGYAAHGTLARQIIDGAKQVRIFRDDIPVKARIYTIGGFSAHADCNELFNWFQKTGTPRQTFLVHGDEEAMQQFSKKLTHTQVIMPERNESFVIP